MSDMPSVQSLEGLKKRLDITIPWEEFNTAFQAHLQKVAKKAKIDGFRPGKVPAKEIERRYGAGILQEVAQELIQKRLADIFSNPENNEFRIAGAPSVNPGEIKKGESLQFTVDFEVYPEVTLADLSDASVEKIAVEVADKDIDNMLEQLRKQQAEWKEVDRPAEEGDKVHIDFEGTLDGEAFENGSAKDFQLELGSKQMIPGFEDGIVGAKVEETREVTATFPDDYPREDLAKKEASFKVTVNKILAPELPEVNDALAEKVGVKGGLTALREDISKTMTREVDRALKTQLKADILDQLVKANEVDVPNALIDQEIQHLQNMTRQYMQEQGQVSKEAAAKMELPRDHYEGQARQRVVLGLLLGEVIKKYEIKVDQEKVDQKIEEIAAAYEDPSQVVTWYRSNQRMMSEVESVVLEDQAVDKLLEMVQVNEKAMSYDDALKHSEEKAKKQAEEQKKLAE